MASVLAPRLLKALPGDAACIRRPRCVHIAATPQGNSSGTGNDINIKHISTDQVKAILKKEHEHHGQGKVMFCHMEGRGRRITVGHDELHSINLSGLPYQSVDYSYMN